MTREIERLKSSMEGSDAGPLALVTVSEPNLTHTGTGITVAAGAPGSATAGPQSPHLPASQSVHVVGAAAGKYCQILRVLCDTGGI